MLQTQKKDLVENEMNELTKEYQNDKLEFIKNPVIAEFLGMASNTDFTESDLENSILSNLQKFLMELGKGYAFVARQQHIHTEKQDYYIDLVFYNYILKCFVLIDLKTQKITHQDVGQMDMYIRMYDELKRSEGDNPTIGIVLCSDTDEDIAKYSILHGNEQLFASKYKLYLPTEEELRAEIENQKTMFYLQQQENNETKKIHMLTAAALLEIYFNQPCMDYNDLMKLTKILTNNNWDDIDNMYRRMCFNVYAHNRDDHAKNFTYIYDEENETWRLSPAYDLTYSNTYYGEHTTTVAGNGRNPGIKELTEVGVNAGLKKQYCEAGEIRGLVEDMLNNYI